MNQSEPLNHEKIVAQNNALIDAFFNFTLTPDTLKKYAKPSLPVVPLERPQEPRKKRKFAHKGTSYAEQYRHELMFKDKTSSNLNISTMVSGPSHQVPSTFAEGSVFDDDEVVTFGTARNINFRKNLPIHKHHKTIMRHIESSPVTLIQGATGCGKSTQVPQYIYDTCAKKNQPCNIIISQPRKIAAVTIAYRVAKERDLEVGNEVGYQVSLDKCTGDRMGEKTQITYCTTGVILQKFILAKSMNAYTHVILDEVHERTVETDLLITIIRRFLGYNSFNTKVILMSATMDCTDFVDYFKMPTNGPDYFLPPIIDLSHDERNFPIREYFIDELTDHHAPLAIRDRFNKCFRGNAPEISTEMYQTTTQLITFLLLKHNKMKKHAATILVFLPGIYEIEIMKNDLESYSAKCDNRFVPFNIFILHSMLSTEEQKKVFIVSDKAKIILSTNIAESSITIPAVTHVINFCLTKKLDTDPKMNRLQTLVCTWATQNHCQQRAGRTGRVCDGMAFHLVTKDFYNRKMSKHPKPEILELPLESVILNVKKLEMGTPLDILACSLDPPPYEAIVEAVLRLKELGGLNRVNRDGIFEFDDGDITFIGEIMAALPCDPRISKLIIMGYVFSVLEEALIISAGLSVQGIFKKSSGSKMNEFKNKVNWADESQSDLIAILNIYSEWNDKKRSKYFTPENSEAQWCTENGIDFKNINEMRLWIDEVRNRLRHFKIENLPHGHQPIWNKREKVFAVKIAIAAAFGIGNFSIPAINVTCERDAFNMVEDLDPRNTVYFRNMPKNIIGRVYESQIINTLINEGVCSANSKVKVTFDLGQSERVFVSFLDENNDDGKIPQEVYNAVKLRRLKSGITMRVMPPNETLNFAIENGFGRLEDGKYVENRNTMKNPEYCALPTCFEKELKGYITHVISFSKFYFKPHVSFGPDFKQLNTRHNKICSKIEQILKQTELKGLKNTDECSIGDILAVNYDDNMERGQVIKILDGINMKLKLIDIGKDICVFAYDCSRLINPADNKEIHRYPPRAILCSLQEVRPAGFNDKWNETAIGEFATASKDKKITIKVFSIVNDVVSVKLYQTDDGGNEICWNEKIVAEGTANECEETFGSKMDHDKRENRRSAFWSENKRIITPREEFQKKLLPPHTKPIHHINLYECSENVFLKGPVSPLEVPIKAVCKQVNGYVTIDGSSVNQVMLNDINRQGFCVAAEMYLDKDSEGVKLRETTLYPNIPGLPVLLALMFGTKIQVNRDEDKNRYASILCGLGADDENLPYYAARDASLYVDFDLKPSDFIAINNLRFLMSKLLYVEPHTNMKVPNLGDGQRENLLRRIKVVLVKILIESRTRRETDETGVIFEWTKDVEDIEEQPKFHNHIFEFIEYPTLVKMSQEKIAKLLDHAEDLETGGHKYMKLYSQECKLCNVFWSNRGDLAIHLLSSLHQKRKQDLINSLEK